LERQQQRRSPPTTFILQIEAAAASIPGLLQLPNSFARIQNKTAVTGVIGIFSSDVA
jgi:hypothetical protein